MAFRYSVTVRLTFKTNKCTKTTHEKYAARHKRADSYRLPV